MQLVRLYFSRIFSSPFFVQGGLTFVTQLGLLQVMLLGPFISMFSGKKMTSMLVSPNGKDLAFIRDLMESGKDIPFIDKRYPLSQVADAIRYIEDRRNQGKVVITNLANKES